jgi:hypothetical protein
MYFSYCMLGVTPDLSKKSGAPTCTPQYIHEVMCNQYIRANIKVYTLITSFIIQNKSYIMGP